MFTNIQYAALVFEDCHSSDAQNLLSQLLVKDPAKRLSDTAKIMTHAFFKPIDFNALM
jgi:hypothetical protein